LTNSVGFGKTRGFSAGTGLEGKGGLLNTGLLATGGLDNCPSELDFSGSFSVKVFDWVVFSSADDVIMGSDFDWLTSGDSDSDSDMDGFAGSSISKQKIKIIVTEKNYNRV
jgi:hypothetical protein